ncbi:MAG TPA: RNA polymerase subunit sigma-24 [Lentisphaeria bacterium]|jgi:RNA polymerase sigma-70 factor (ECF subfamily)|nr:RNA polymerase subunit sigma-24 [Lentisphaeria bacterium]
MDTSQINNLITQAQGGDDDAYAELYELHRKTVYAIGYRLVGPDDADDVVMDTFLKSWKSIPGFNRKSKFNTWLYRIAHNCATDMLRKRKRNREHVMAEDEYDSRTLDHFHDKTAPEPGADLANTEENSIVQQCIRKLDNPYRTILLLRYADELSYAEIAAAMDSSLGTVMSRLFYAKRKLKKLVNELL